MKVKQFEAMFLSISLMTALALSAYAQEEKAEGDKPKAEEKTEKEEKAKPTTSADEVVAEEGKEAEKKAEKKEEKKGEPAAESEAKKETTEKKAETPPKTEIDDEEWKEWESEEWKEEIKPKPKLQFLELHGYLRMRGEWFYNLHLGTYNPFIESPAQTPNNSRSSSKVQPPVESRPYSPSMLKAGNETVIKDEGESLNSLKESCYTGGSCDVAKIAAIQDLIDRGIISEADAQSETKKIVQRRSSYLDAQDDGKSLRSVNMRLRLDPILNISEDIRILSQIDVLDNLVLGSTPDTLGSSDINSISPMPPFSTAQIPPSDGRNSLNDSIRVKRAWAEVMTPLGQLRFGRMGSNWGLGILANDGNRLDSDYASTVDRIMFITKLFGFYIVPAFDFIYEGVTNADSVEYSLAGGQFYDISQKDDVNQYILAIAYKEDEEVIKRKLERDEVTLNGGFYGVYRKQDWDMPDVWKQQKGFYDGISAQLDVDDMVSRDLDLFIPDLWLKFMWRKLRIETEMVMIVGKIGNDTKDDYAYSPSAQLNKATSSGNTVYVEPALSTEVTHNEVDILQWGGVLQSDYKFVNDALKVGFEFGIASGDDHGGWGVRPLFKEDKQYNDKTTKNRKLRDAYTARLEKLDKDINDLQGKTTLSAEEQMKLTALKDEFDSTFQSYYGLFNKKDDLTINNFRFHPDYRVDLILWREVIGLITDAYYFKPSIAYQLFEGFSADLAAIYSRAMFKESTPGYDHDLGLEFDLGLYYVSHDNFHFGLQFGLLFPFAGMDNLGANYQPDIVYAEDSFDGFKKDIESQRQDYIYDPASARNPDDVEAFQDYNATTAFRLRFLVAVTF
ncbi:MAG: hypothetical protein Kow0090_13560 [Myxococcota bacterium]